MTDGLDRSRKAASVMQPVHWREPQSRVGVDPEPKELPFSNQS